MKDQDHVNERSCCLIIRGGRLTGKTLAFAMGVFLSKSKKAYRDVTTHHGKQTVKQLATQGTTLTNIEIKDENIKSFESTARKYVENVELPIFATIAPRFILLMAYH